MKNLISMKAAMRAADRKNFLALESLIASELEEVIKE